MKYLLIGDAGHAEYVKGKQSQDGSLKEYEFNNDMQYRIKKKVEYNGIDVYLTNPNPQKIDEMGLTKRAQLANDYWAKNGKPKALFFSIHANAYSGESARGTETFIASNASQNSKNAARYLQDEVVKTMLSLDKGAKDRGVKTENFTVIYKANMPAILAEYAFYTNPADRTILQNNREELAEASARSICKYFGVEYKTPQTVTNFLVVVDTDTLNVREGAGTNYKVVTTVKRGEVYTIVEETNGWGKLKSGAGWISLAYTKKK